MEIAESSRSIVLASWQALLFFIVVFAKNLLDFNSFGEDANNWHGKETQVVAREFYLRVPKS